MLTLGNQMSQYRTPVTNEKHKLQILVVVFIQGSRGGNGWISVALKIGVDTNTPVSQHLLPA